MMLLGLIAEIAQLINKPGVAIGAGALHAFFGNLRFLREKVIGQGIRDCAVFESCSALLAD
jgi:hypothetical protein